MKNLAIAALLGCLGGCAVAPVTAPPERLFVDARFAPPRERIGADDIFALNDAMRHYLHVENARGLREDGPVRGLIHALSQRGEIKLDYDATMTRNAAQAFDARKGNCLSLVIMTAALARELHLDVYYQEVENETTWSRRGNVAFRNGHVNLTLGRRAVDAFRGYDPARLVTVDFLPAEEIAGQRTRPISEGRIVAMYMNNRAAEALADDRLDDAYWWARAALLRDPAFSDAYNTLGVIYLRHGDSEEAAQALTYLLERDSSNAPALSNLLVVREREGRTAEANNLRARLAGLEPDPPYHYFFLGLAAMKKGDFAAAQQLFEKEVGRAGYSGEFHYWLGIAHYKLGHAAAARQQMAIAMQNSITESEYALYAGKFERLRSLGVQ